MKILNSFMVLVIVFTENIGSSSSDNNPSGDTRFSHEAVIHQLLERIGYLILSGDVENELTVLDPYKFQFGHLNFTGEILNANVNITNGTCTGLGSFSLQKFFFSKNEMAITLEVNIPSLKFYSDYYELDGNLYNAVPIKGQGVVDIEVHNIVLRGKVYLKQSVDGKLIVLNKIEDPQFNIEQFVSRTQFDRNIDAIINTMVEDLLADYLTRFSKYIAAGYSDSIIHHLNPILEKFETWNHIIVLLSNSNK